MFIYSLKKQYDPNSGEEVDPVMKPCGKICDYTGCLIDPDNDEEKPLYATTLHYDRGCEEAWYYDDERQKLEDEMGVEYDHHFTQFIEGPYHFSVGYDEDGYRDASLDLISEWMCAREKKVGFKKSELGKCTTLDGALRISRYRTLFRLLREGKYKLKDLGMPPKEDE